MKNINKQLIGLVGNTPLLELAEYNKRKNLNSMIIAKIESFNPLSSVKDRAGLAMIKDGEEKGKINSDTVIIESTSGNLGIALAFVCASKGYRLILTMPESMSAERRSLLKALGAELILTPKEEGMRGAIDRAQELALEHEDSYLINQFGNPSNVEAHYSSTGPEIWSDSNEDIDLFVAGVGTGATISGTGKYLKEKNSILKVIAVEPEESPVISGGSPGPHKIQGIGAGFIPENLNVDLIDETIQVTYEEAVETARALASAEGLLVGPSSGAALAGATKLAKKVENFGKKIVVILPDSGERYLSTDLFESFEESET